VLSIILVELRVSVINLGTQNNERMVRWLNRSLLVREQHVCPTLKIHVGCCDTPKIMKLLS